MWRWSTSFTKLSSHSSRNASRGRTRRENYQVSTPLKSGSAADSRFQFDESSQLFLRARNETPSVAAMCIHDPDCSPVGINDRHTAPLQPTLLRSSGAFIDYC